MDGFDQDTVMHGFGEKIDSALFYFKITPRFILSESRDTTQSFNMTFRTPTGVNANIGTNIAAITPSYKFWTNWWKGLVVRGGTGFFVPYGGDLNASGARSTYNANLGSRLLFYAA